jgi:hypothetical protein
MDDVSRKDGNLKENQEAMLEIKTTNRRKSVLLPTE